MFVGGAIQMEINLVRGRFLSEKSKIETRRYAFAGLGQSDSCKDFLPFPIVKSLWV